MKIPMTLAGAAVLSVLACAAPSIGPRSFSVSSTNPTFFPASRSSRVAVQIAAATGCPLH